MLDYYKLSIIVILITLRYVFKYFGTCYLFFNLIKVPLKVSFFTWLAALGKILTIDNLRKQRVIVVDWCCMWKKSGEFVDHLLLYYEIASALWNSTFSLFGLDWVMPRRVVDLFACWTAEFGSIHSVAVCKMISSCLMWCIWRGSNDQSFEDSERIVVELKAFFFNTLYHLTVAYDCFHISSFFDFLVLCTFFG